MTTDIATTAPVAATPVSRTLRDAVSYLARHGWIQGCYYDQTATVFTPAADVVGALAMVCYGGPCEAPAEHFTDPGFGDFADAVAYLDRYFAEHYGDGAENYCVYDFNDTPGRIADQVLTALYAAANAWESLDLGGAR